MSKENRKIEIITIPIAATFLAIVAACIWYVLTLIFLRLYIGTDFSLPTLSYFIKTTIIAFVIILAENIRHKLKVGRNDQR
jgi:small-conductance mechanosensitive channel